MTRPTPETSAAEHFRRGPNGAVSIRHRTVAAIAGGWLGAAYGTSAMPLEWLRLLHGWPSLTARGLVALANTVARGGRPLPAPSYAGGRIDTLTPTRTTRRICSAVSACCETSRGRCTPKA